MSCSPFHMAWFLNFATPAWSGPWRGDGRSWANGSFYEEMAQSLERAGFDYMMFEDSAMIPVAYGGSAEIDLKYAVYGPKNDPVPLMPVLARATRHIGLVATASTSFYPPWLLARTYATLDHITEGRIGWNMVTSSEDLAAQNFGMDALPEHDERYERAEEFMDLVRRLWDSWDADAVVMDEENDTYVDHTKVHPIDFRGKYFASRGPLNTFRGPQGHPVICQAGGSSRGRDFASRNADTLLANPKGVEAMKAYRDDIRSRMLAHGRHPDDCKVMFVVYPILGETDREAQEKAERTFAATDKRVHTRLAQLSAQTEIDLSQFPLDEPLPDDLETNGHQFTLDIFKTFSKGKTLREAASNMTNGAVNFVGSPDTVAAQMEEVMTEVGGDGFLINAPGLTRRYVDEVASGLAPALQKRGLMRTGYDHKLFRDNLLAF